MTAINLPGPRADRPWVSGIKRPDDVVEAEVDSWLRRAASVLSLRFIDDVPRGATAAAESGLEIAPCAYWYVFRSDPRYGFVVFLWREDESSPFRDGDGAVTPFDSGGIWHERIQTTSAMNAGQRKDFVASHSRPASEWLEAMLDWVAANYDDAADYLVGKPPSVGVPGIVYSKPNEAAAWTWEARLEKTAYRGQVTVRHVFWTQATRTAFEDWLEDADLDELDAENLVRLVAALTIETPAIERASEGVGRHLLRILDHEHS